MKEKESFYLKFIQSSYVGVSQVVFTFVCYHPFDYLKTRMQANVSSTLSNRALVAQVYNVYGFKGFYIGGRANFSRAVLKEIYRNPVRGIMKGFYTEKLPKSLQIKYPEIRNVATGISMAIFDTFILCPLERIKVWVMTTDRKGSFTAYFNQNKNFFKDLFKGLQVSFVRSVVSWTSYLVFEEDIRKYITRNNFDKENIPLKQQIMIGVLAGLVNSVLTLPFDTVKTQIQKYGSNSEKQLIYNAFRSIIKKNGVGGLYAGWVFRLPSYVIVGLITSKNIQKIDKIWNVEEKS